MPTPIIVVVLTVGALAVLGHERAVFRGAVVAGLRLATGLRGLGSQR